MTKEFEINDILSAVNSIYELERKKTKIIEKKATTDKNGILTLNKEAKSNKSEILVLNQRIE